MQKAKSFDRGDVFRQINARLSAPGGVQPTVADVLAPSAPSLKL